MHMTSHIILHNGYLLTSLAYILELLALFSIKRKRGKAIQTQAELY